MGDSSDSKLTEDFQDPQLNDVHSDKTKLETPPKWIDNYGDEVENVFGFSENAELVNGRLAMFGFLMLIITELVFSGEPVTRALFGFG